MFLMDADYTVTVPGVVPEKKPSKMGFWDWPGSTPAFERSAGTWFIVAECDEDPIMQVS